jgi:ribonuclease HII
MAAHRLTIERLRQLVRGGELSAGQLQRLRRDPRAGARRLAEQELERLRHEQQRLGTLLTFERRLWREGFELVAGVDEAGAGPLAGPVVAAAVILPRGASITGIDDSKKLSRGKREALEPVVRDCAVAAAIGLSTPAEIDRLNILQASRLAMRRAVEALAPAPHHLLVDARTVPAVPMPQTPVIHGDSRSQSIAAASILAKVYRDRLMTELAADFPGYGFERHAGYGTREHLDALARLGPAPVHRHSFAPVAAAARRGAARPG